MYKFNPFLKWAGGKFRYLNEIIPRLPAGNKLIEPFTGSGSVFINSNYDHYLLAEKNQDLINLYKFVQQEGVTFIDFCACYFTELTNNSDYYYQVREQFNSSDDPRERAARFLYLNRHGYNGLCRFNLKGQFNVPFGRYKTVYFPQKAMVFFHEKSQVAQFIHADFRDTFGMANPGDIIYCDPPYVPLRSSKSFAYNTEKCFNEADQIDLAQLALASANRGVTVVISNHDTPFTRHQYQQGEIFSFPVKRYISCKSDNREVVQELIAIFK